MGDRSIGLPTGLTPGRLLVSCLTAAALGWGAMTVVPAWWYAGELNRAHSEMAAGRFDAALERLERLAARWPGRAEVEYPLGGCLATLGRIDTALAAWARVPRGSSLAPRAALDRARVALDHGRLSVAEDSLTPLLNERGEIGERASRLADQVDLFSGRDRAIARRIERRWPLAADRAGLLVMHWRLETQPFALLAMRDALGRMAREAPYDDRVWLGLAQLAIRTGQVKEADEWLRRCESRRPDDVDVRRARLAWALESGRVDEAVDAASHLPASGVEPTEVAEFVARLAARRGDAAAERAALERLVSLRPGEPSAWDRLAEWATRDGDRGHAEELRRRKARIDRARDEYRMLMGTVASGDPFRAAELARTAEVLGLRFEARGWWTIQVRRIPDDREAREALTRLAREVSVGPATARSLADLIPAPLAAPTGPAPRPSLGPVVPSFRDDALAARLRIVYENDPTPMCRLPETMGGGVGLIDYDGDGWLDVYAVQGGRLPNEASPARTLQRDRLYRNRRDGTFEDVTATAGLASFPGGYGHGVTVGDYDNDGRPDLFVTRWRSYALYRNKGDGTFEDVTAFAGLGGPRDWPTSAAFADLDGDGDLDLYVCHYSDWDPVRSPLCPHPTDPNRHGYCVPRSFGAMADHVLRNDGGRFVDVSECSGVHAADRDGRGLGVVAAHLDDDDRIDLFVANDMTANLFFRNQGAFRFGETATESGVATNAVGGYLAGMGIACGDLDGDGRVDLSVSNFYGESTTFYQNLGAGQFADHASAINLAAPTRHVLGFGICFFDANNDGRLDLAQANGHVNDYRPSIPFAMPAQLFLGSTTGRLVDVSESAGACWNVPRLGRGLAFGDLDNDGRMDLLVVASGEPLAYFHNLGPAGHFITLQLEGAFPRSNRDAVGARVSLVAAGHRQVAQRIGGGSFLSAGDHRLHFGLGDATRIEAIEVRWPSGRVDRYTGLAADAAYLLREAHSEVGPLPGWRRPSRESPLP